MDTTDKAKDEASVLTASDLQTLEKLVEDEPSQNAAPISPDKAITENDNSERKDADVIVASAFGNKPSTDGKDDIHSGNLLITIEELKKILSHQANELNYVQLVNRQLSNENQFLKTENQRLTLENARKTNPNNGKDERPAKKQKKAKSIEDQENTESEAEKQSATPNEQPLQPLQQ
jgi:hypothetical protein